MYNLSNSRRKKVAHVGFVWNPDTLFQPNDISVGTSFSCKNTVKHIHFQHHIQEINLTLKKLTLITLEGQ